MRDPLARLRRGGCAVEAARARPQLLTSAISGAASLDELTSIFLELSPAFNQVHTAALVTRLPKVLRQQQQQQQQAAVHTSSSSCSSSSGGRHAAGGGVAAPLTQQQRHDLESLLADLALLCEEVLPHCSPRELSNIAWGLAAAGSYSRRLMQLLLGRARLAALRPQELANLAYAVARCGHQVPEGWVDELLLLSAASLDAGAFSPQEAANTAWALATLQRQCLLLAVVAPAPAPAPPPPPPPTPPTAAAAAALSDHHQQQQQQQQQPHHHRPTSACARVEPAWVAAFCRAADAQRGALTAPDLAQGLWALAVLGPPGGLQQAWLDRMLAHGAQLLLLGSGQGQGQQVLYQQGQQGGRMASRHVASMMWAVSKLQQQQQQQQQWAAAAPTRSSSSSSAGSSSSSSSSTTGLHLFAEAVSAQLPALLAGERRPLRFAAVLLNACGRLRLQLPPAAMHTLLAAGCRQLLAGRRGAHSSAAAAAAAAAVAAEEQQAGGASRGAAGSTTTWAQQQQQQQSQQRQQQAALQAAEADLTDVSVLLHALVSLSYRPAGQVLDVLAGAAAAACWEVVAAHDSLAAAAAAATPAANTLSSSRSSGSSSSSTRAQGSGELGQHGRERQHHRQVLTAAAAAAARQQRLPRTRGRELSLLLWGLAKQCHIDGSCAGAASSLPGQLLRPLRMAASRQLHLFSASDVALLLWAHARGRASAGPDWTSLLLQHFLVVLDDSPRGAPDVANVVHALAHLAGSRAKRAALRATLTQQRLLQRLGAAAAARFGEAGPRELVAMAQGFAALGFRPGGGWLQQHRGTVDALLLRGRGGECAVAAAAAASGGDDGSSIRSSGCCFSVREQAILAAAYARLAAMAEEADPAAARQPAAAAALAAAAAPPPPAAAAAGQRAPALALAA